MLDEQLVFTRMVTVFSAAWVLLVCGVVILVARGKRLDRNLGEMRRQIPGSGS
jgi:hypothetical protein